ncbi:hypothetical protein D9757_013143 [Collybiopsis confluens]|uniref:cellulase n=1 Tax=Collybiopsis confluens TaxID=2823264 RepID=A0A8H5LV35_9AGAR|nr:hypothetical protein D9757_013143 [Collybiopsis confluens]
MKILSTALAAILFASPGALSAALTDSSESLSQRATKVRFAGVNIAGYDFGMVITGTQDLTQVVDEASDGTTQMKHFVNNDKFNLFRLPTGWQFLANNVLGGTLNSANLARYDALVQGCLATGAFCIVDIHNYARWNGGIIGQGGPTDDQFVSLWTQLATKYKSQSRVVFGVMNEPHDLVLSTWVATVQKVVTAIRNTGATSQMILLPGTDFTSAGDFVTNGSGPALLAVKNPDGTTTNLIFDVHKYLDSDNSGTHTECVTNNIDDAFAPLATWLRTNGRQALLSETGGGNVQSCATFMCQELAFLNANSDVYLGYTGWSAGGFAPSWDYNLTEVPTGNTDTFLVQQCIAGLWLA